MARNYWPYLSFYQTSLDRCFFNICFDFESLPQLALGAVISNFKSSLWKKTFLFFIIQLNLILLYTLLVHFSFISGEKVKVFVWFIFVANNKSNWSTFKEAFGYAWFNWLLFNFQWIQEKWMKTLSLISMTWKIIWKLSIKWILQARAFVTIYACNLHLSPSQKNVWSKHQHKLLFQTSYKEVVWRHSVW